jgi:hypothetical protein
MSPMEMIVLVKRKQRKRKRNLGPFFLQGRALGPPQFELFLQLRKFERNGKRIPS